MQSFNNPKVFEDADLNEDNIYNGVDYILKGFEQFDIVAIGESHGYKDVTDFYVDLIKNEDFRKTVDVVVFELGNSRYQDVLDDYILGNSSDTLTIKKLWRDHTSSIVQSGDMTGVSRFFKEVREVNRISENKIRILAADPPVDWSKLSNSIELMELIGQRDKYYTDVVMSEIISEKKKALLIMGSRHFNKCNLSHKKMDNPIISILRATNQNMLLVTTMTMDNFPYDHLPNINKGEVIETINPVVGDILLSEASVQGCALKSQTDALLYFGTKKDLVREVSTSFDDEAYETELNRRKEMISLKQGN